MAHLARGRLLHDMGKEAEALDAFRFCAQTEGIIPALESAHALAWVARERAALAGKRVLLNLSGRGDKDLTSVLALLRAEGGVDDEERFARRPVEVGS